MEKLKNLQVKTLAKSLRRPNLTTESFLVTTAQNRALNVIPEKIFGFLDPKDLLQCRLVHSSWKEIVDNPKFWLQILKSKGMVQYDVEMWKLFLEDTKQDRVRKEIKLCLMKLAIDNLQVSIYKQKLKKSSFSLKLRSIAKVQMTPNPTMIAFLNKNVVWINAMMTYPKSRKMALKFFAAFKIPVNDQLNSTGWLTLLDVLLEASFDKKHRGNKTIEVITPMLGDIRKGICKTWSPLERTVMTDNFNGAKIIIGYSDDVSLKDAFRHALIRKNVKLVELIVEHLAMRGISINYRFDFAEPRTIFHPVLTWFEFDFVQGYTPMTLAARRGPIKIVDILAQVSENLNEVDEFGLTPLAAATFSGKFHIGRLLLSYESQISNVLEENDSNNVL